MFQVPAFLGAADADVAGSHADHHAVGLAGCGGPRGCRTGHHLRGKLRSGCHRERRCCRENTRASKGMTSNRLSACASRRSRHAPCRPAVALPSVPAGARPAGPLASLFGDESLLAGLQKLACSTLSLHPGSLNESSGLVQQGRRRQYAPWTRPGVAKCWAVSVRRCRWRILFALLLRPGHQRRPVAHQGFVRDLHLAVADHIALGKPHRERKSACPAPSRRDPALRRCCASRPARGCW